MNIDNVTTQKFAGTANLTGPVVAGDKSTLANLPLWEPSITSQSYQKLQQNGTGFTLAGLSLDRYLIDGVLTPFVIGVRQVNAADLPTQSWVNIHLQYTHGYGAILSPANSADRREPELRHLGCAADLDRWRPDRSRNRRSTSVSVRPATSWPTRT